MLNRTDRMRAWEHVLELGRADELCDRIVSNHHSQFGVPHRLIRTLSRAEPVAPVGTLGVPLSSRELDVLALASRKMTAEQSAERLHIGLESVRTYRKKAIRKMQARNAWHASQIAIDRGLIPEAPSDVRERVAA